MASGIRPVATWKDGDCCLSESCWGWWWCTHVCRAKHLCPGPPLQSTMASGSMGGEPPVSSHLSSYADASKYTNTQIRSLDISVSPTGAQGRSGVQLSRGANIRTRIATFPASSLSWGARDSREQIQSLLHSVHLCSTCTLGRGKFQTV